MATMSASTSLRTFSTRKEVISTESLRASTRKRSSGGSSSSTRKWSSLREGRSVLDPYGAENTAEFLAVSVEGFFERAKELDRHHPELYQMLSRYFALDPASWER